MTIEPTLALTEADIAVLSARMLRLTAIERAAWQALELSRAGRAMDAYHVLSEALEPTCAPTS
jgi:hypothetical protein